MDASGYQGCMLCPRICRVDRTAGEKGFCNAGDSMVLSSAVLHFGEEPPISGAGGSGTLFFSGCTLGCPYCQNCQISDRHRPLGREITHEQFGDICLEIQDRGGENINLVTATQFIPSLENALSHAAKRGFRLPVVWNSSGFELPEALSHIDPYIDIYLLDIKTLNRNTARRFCRTEGYVDAVKDAVLWAVEKKPLKYQGDRLAGGTIIRHLVLPGELESSRDVLSWYAHHIGSSALISLMLQFIDPNGVLAPEDDVQNQVLMMLDDFGIDEGFVQEPADDDIWLPDFSQENPFPKEFSRPVWHWRCGFIPDR